MEVRTYQEEFGGKPLLIEIGKLAQQANGSVRVQYGETTVLVTAVMGSQAKNIDYFPLSVEFEEKYYAAGKIKGSKWIKREGRPSEEAVLSGRLIDRTLRPRFDQRARNDVQVVATVLSFDKINDADMVALFGASLALMISDIPFNGPVAGVRVGRVGGKLIINPTYLERIDSDFDIVVAGTSSRINMIEAGAKIVAEKDMAEGVEYGFKEYQKLITLQEKIAKDVAPIKQELALAKLDEELGKKVTEFAIPKLNEALFVKDKKVYYANQAKVHDEVKAYIKETYADAPDLAKKLEETDHHFEEAINTVIHQNILEQGKRSDGRKHDELREISAEVSVLPHSHGTGLFNRGQTQALSSLTLAAPGMEQWIETMEIDLTKKRFMHHYVFPPFSVGETGRLGMPGRREIGHGALAEKALLPIIPAKEDFPYTIRVVSEILGSNGSSSMASVCGATLAMMDGGVPLKMPAAGIAMGIMFDEKYENYKILTDIQGPEDHHGDMDLKVAGTKDGVTAMQMDVKVDGITPQIVAETLEQARKARMEILGHMEKAIATPRSALSSYAPRVQTIKINPGKIGAVIGSGGKTINGIIEETGAEIDIEDDGSIFITCGTSEGMDRAIARIKELTYEPQAGEVFEGTVVKLLDFGAFVEILPGMDGMVHVSEISQERVDRPADVLKVGQKVRVMIKNVDDMGRINLTIKNAPQE
jgi:polyribonucleotide nucleotidyltransferase